MAELLELVLPITDPVTGRPTPYFEDYLRSIVVDLGGEGSTDIDDAIASVALAAEVPYIVGRINRLIKRVEDLEGDLSLYRVARQVTQLQVDTAGFTNITTRVAYTAKPNEWVEAFNAAQITLPANPTNNQRVRITNGDGSYIQVSGGSLLKLKIRGTLETYAVIGVAGNSYDFQWFGSYWLVA